jgi:hypothetical protein
MWYIYKPAKRFSRGLQGDSMMSVKHLAVGLVALSVGMISSSAMAGNPKSQERNTRYEFPDDPLTALGNDDYVASIRVHQTPIRSRLIRPKTTFVPELLKSVGNL